MTETASPSMEDRIMSSMGLAGVADAEPAAEGEADAVGETAEGQQESDFEVEWNGATHKVPAALKDAFFGQKDYTQKTQALAEDRRTLDQLREVAQTGALDREFQGSIANEAQELSVIDAYLAQMSKTDWTGMSTDQMFKAKMEIDSIKERRTTLKEAIEGKRQAFTKNFSTKLSALKAKSRELASKAIPNFTEETEKGVRAFALAEGLGEQEIDNVLMDPRSYKILWKAAQYEKVVKTTGKAVAAAEKVVKPGAASERMPAQTAANLNFRKAMSGAKTSGDKANVIEQRLQSLFARGKS